MPFIVIQGGVDTIADTLNAMDNGTTHPYVQANKNRADGTARFSGEGPGGTEASPNAVTIDDVVALHVPGNYLIEWS